MRKVRRESGVARFHAHLCRHTFAQHAIDTRADRGLVADMLGHTTDRHTRRYTQSARRRDAAERMPAHSPV
jgi:integrase